MAKAKFRSSRGDGQKTPQKSKKPDAGALVKIPNPLLRNAFGDPFMLANYRYDAELVEQLRNSGDADVDKDDERLVPLVHTNVAYAVEAFIRSRDAQGRNLVVKSQGDSDRVWDIGQIIKDHRDDDELILARGDYRWLTQKAGELAFEAFPIDARMFIDHLKAADDPTDAVDDKGDDDDKKDADDGDDDGGNKE